MLGASTASSMELREQVLEGIKESYGRYLQGNSSNDTQSSNSVSNKNAMLAFDK